MLNCDYKIAAKVIAERIKNALPTIINCDQTGFLKGRFIGENIRLIDFIISYCERKTALDYFCSWISRKLLTHWSGNLFKRH